MAPTPTPADSQRDSELAAQISKGITDGLAQHSPKKVSFGRYEPHSPFHPGMKKDTPRLKRECFQNGIQLDPKTLFDEEIRNLNKITVSGNYVDGENPGEKLIEVIVKQVGTNEVVHINYSNGTIDRRFELKGSVRNFKDMLKQILEGQDEKAA